MPEVSDAFLNGVVDYVEATSGVMTKLAEQEQKVAEFGPQVVDTLIKTGFLTENRREDAIQATTDHLKVLESLQKTAESIDKGQTKRASAEPEAESMGGGVKKETPASSGVDQHGMKLSEVKQAANQRFESAFLGGRV
jgi:hypothetical protein